MAGQTEADTGAVDEPGSAGQSQQTDAGATGAAVPERRDGAPESRASGSAKDEARPSDTRVSEFEYRIKKLESDIRKVRKVFLDHTHETLSDTPPAVANTPATSGATSGDAGSSGLEAEAVKPAIAEKPPVQTEAREEQRKQATAQYFTRIHRHKRHARAGVDD